LNYEPVNVELVNDKPESSLCSSRLRLHMPPKRRCFRSGSKAALLDLCAATLNENAQHDNEKHAGNNPDDGG
jgi:hypothetical protein